MCHLWHISCHLSPVTNVISSDPPPANSPLRIVGWFARTVFGDQPIYKKRIKNPKSCPTIPKKRVPWFCNFSNMLFDQKSPVHTFLGLGQGIKQTSILTYRMNWPWGRFSEKLDIGGRFGLHVLLNFTLCSHRIKQDVTFYITFTKHILQKKTLHHFSLEKLPLVCTVEKS